MRIAGLILLIMTTVCWTAPAAAGQSRLTSIANAGCIFAPIGDEPGDEKDQLKTCPGLGGAQVLVNALGTRLRIGFRWPKGPLRKDRLGHRGLVRRNRRRLAWCKQQ